MNGTEDVSVSPVASEVLGAAVVVAFDVRAVEASGAGRAIDLEVLEVLKGRVASTPGDRVVVEVEVHSNADLWGTVTVGDRYVAYCDASSTDLRVLLQPAHCAQLAIDRAAGVLEDVRLVRSVQNRHLVADQLLGTAEARRATAGPVFARYLWVAAREALRTSSERFARLMAVAQDAATRVDAQEAYLVSAYEDLTFSEAFPEQDRVLLVRTMLASALDPRLGALRERLLGTYVPNLVRLPLPRPLTPGEVFSAEDDLRDALRAELADDRDPATTSPALADWLGVS